MAPRRTPDHEAAEPDAVVFRSYRLITLCAVVCVGLLVLTAFVWYSFPASVKALWLPSQVATVVLILVALMAGVVIIAASNVRADPTGLRIRNGLSRHRIPWDSVYKFLLRPGDPWAMVLVEPTDRPFEVGLDAERRQLMGIQAGDGRRADEAIRTLTAMHRRYATRPAMPSRDR